MRSQNPKAKDPNKQNRTKKPNVKACLELLQKLD